MPSLLLNVPQGAARTSLSTGYSTFLLPESSPQTYVEPLIFYPAMPKTFLYAGAEDESMPSTGGDRPNGEVFDHRDKVRILVIGRPSAVNRVITEMSHVGFSDSVEWSKPIPTDRQKDDREKESMRILTRYVFGNS